MPGKEQIIRSASKGSLITQKEMSKVVDSFLAAAAKELIATGHVELRGFGTFTVRTRPANATRHPKTGQRIEIPETRRVHFRAGSSVLVALNQGE